MVLSQNIASNRQKPYNLANDYFSTLKKKLRATLITEILCYLATRITFLLDSFEWWHAALHFSHYIAELFPTLPLILFRCIEAKVWNGNKWENV